MLTIRALAFLLVVGGVAEAQPRQTLTHELLWSFQRVGAPVPSPDGKWVVFSVTEPAYDPQLEITDLWIVPADGTAPPRRLTSTKGGESGPAWSPDATRIAFAARRDGDEVNQIYVLDVARGGDAQRVTNAPTSASAPQWSPDGKRLLFQAAMWSGSTDEESNRKAVQERRNPKSRARIYDTFPVRNWDRWIDDDSKTHVWVVELEKGTAARSLLAGSTLASLPGFGPDSLSPVWSPDGQSVIFAATEHNDRSARSVVPTCSGKPVSAEGSRRNWGWRVGTSARRDSVRTARRCASPQRNAKPAIYQLTRLGCGAWPWNGEITVVTRDFDRAISSWAFSSDSKTIYLSAEDAGHERIYLVPVAGGQTRLAVDAPEGAFTSVQIPPSSTAPVLFANWESAVRPPEIVRINPASGARTFLTTFTTKKAESIDWLPLREFWFTGRDGRRIHNLVALPPGFDETKKYPLFVLIHGGHANMWRDSITYRWNYHLLAHPGFVVLMTDYRGSTGYGEKFTLDILGDPLAGPADDLNDAADEAIKRYPFIDGTRQAAGGASYGGHLANWLAGTTTRYKALISHAGLATLDMQWGTSDGIYHRELMMDGPYWQNPQKWIEQSPLAKAGNFKTPMLVSVGENDFRVPEGNALTMYAALQRMSVPSRLIIWPDENHWILKGENSRVFYREVRAWLEKYLLGGGGTQ